MLAAAANGEASVLVTSNIRHFDPTEAASLGVAVLTPDTLARHRRSAPGHGMAVATAVEMCARHLAAVTDTEGAPVLLGHVDVDAPPWSLGAGLRSALVSAVAGSEHLVKLKAVGASMDRRRAVEYALERLDTAD